MKSINKSFSPKKWMNWWFSKVALISFMWDASLLMCLFLEIVDEFKDMSFDELMSCENSCVSIAIFHDVFAQVWLWSWVKRSNPDDHLLLLTFLLLHLKYQSKYRACWRLFLFVISWSIVVWSYFFLKTVNCLRNRLCLQLFLWSVNAFFSNGFQKFLFFFSEIHRIFVGRKCIFLQDIFCFGVIEILRVYITNGLLSWSQKRTALKRSYLFIRLRLSWLMQLSF